MIITNISKKMTIIIKNYKMTISKTSTLYRKKKKGN